MLSGMNLFRRYYYDGEREAYVYRYRDNVKMREQHCEFRLALYVVPYC